MTDTCKLTTTFSFPTLASFSHRSRHFACFISVSGLSRSYCALFSATSYLSTHPIRGSRRYLFRFPVPVSSRSRKKREREKSAHSSTSPSADEDHKVSSAEMHVKRFKRAAEVSFVLYRPRSRRRPRRFLLTLRSRLPTAPFATSLIVESIFSTSLSVAAFSRMCELHRHRMHSTALKRATNGTLHCLPTLQQAASSLRVRAMGSAKESSLKYPPASCHAVNCVDAAPTLASFIETSGVRPPRNHTRRQIHEAQSFRKFHFKQESRGRRKKVELTVSGN